MDDVESESEPRNDSSYNYTESKKYRAVTAAGPKKNNLLVVSASVLELPLAASTCDRLQALAVTAAFRVTMLST